MLVKSLLSTIDVFNIPSFLIKNLFNLICSVIIRLLFSVLSLQNIANFLLILLILTSFVFMFFVYMKLSEFLSDMLKIISSIGAIESGTIINTLMNLISNKNETFRQKQKKKQDSVLKDIKNFF
jgi:prolipoprotein diacylglyceryltransferase